jgi:nucleotide-binding universal stress UspA family protein
MIWRFLLTDETAMRDIVMINRILVPIDGSEHAFRAADFAADLAAHYDATLLLLHVIPYETQLSNLQRRYAEADYVEGPSDLIQYALEDEKLLTGARRRALDHGATAVDTLAEPGDPAEVILSHAAKADMVVMGRRGLGRVEALLQGSVSQKVSQLADTACATIK